MNPYANITAALEGVLAEAKDKSLEALYRALQEPGVGSASAGRLLREAVEGYGTPPSSGRFAGSRSCSSSGVRPAQPRGRKLRG